MEVWKYSAHSRGVASSRERGQSIAFRELSILLQEVCKDNSKQIRGVASSLGRGQSIIIRGIDILERGGV